MTDAYLSLLDRKMPRSSERGITALPKLPDSFFRFQRDCVDFGLRAGSWGCFTATGTGKSRMEIAWCHHAAEHSNGMALILTPLAVAAQMAAEGQSLGFDIRVIRSQSEAKPGINVCNYDRLDRLDASAFGAVALDESSCLRDWTGKTTQKLTQLFAGHRWKMAASATPAPNDYMELGTQSEFLGILPMVDMLTRWFCHDSGNTADWRLKGHAKEAFWDWMASWSRMAAHPRDLGDDIDGFDLPPLTIHQVRAGESLLPIAGGLFGPVNVSATDMFKVKRATSAARAKSVAEIVACEPGEPWLLWCDTNDEGAALRAVLPEAEEIRGSDSIDEKEAAIASFCDGSTRVLITKPSMMSRGVNLQHCSRMAFVGRTFSWEQYFQALRRCWRFRQERPVNAYVVVAEGEDAIARAIDRKDADYRAMMKEMTAAMLRNSGRDSAKKLAYHPTYHGRLPSWISNA